MLILHIYRTLTWSSQDIILCMRPANERWCYSVTPSLIGRMHIQSYPCITVPAAPGNQICQDISRYSLDYRVSHTFLIFHCIIYHFSCCYTTKLLGGYTGFTPSVRPSVCPSVRLSVHPSVRPSRIPCPLCIIYSYGWILFILGTNDHYHERVCRAPWPLTLTYIFKVIWPWLRKSCPLCSVYSSGWILSIFGTNDHYH